MGECPTSRRRCDDSCTVQRAAQNAADDYKYKQILRSRTLCEVR